MPMDGRNGAEPPVSIATYEHSRPRQSRSMRKKNLGSVAHLNAVRLLVVVGRTTIGTILTPFRRDHDDQSEKKRERSFCIMSSTEEKRWGEPLRSPRIRMWR